MERTQVIKTAKSIKTHDKVVNIYNSINPLPRGYKLQYSDAWCASYVSAVLHLCGYDAIAECSCVVMTKRAKELGLWKTSAYKPQVGDIIMYDWNNNNVPNHTGIITDVINNTLTVIEGNKSGAIGYRTLNITSKYIEGYIVPPYDKSANMSHTELLERVYKSIDDIVSGIIKGDFGNGDTRKESLYKYFQNLVNERLNK